MRTTYTNYERAVSGRFSQLHAPFPLRHRPLRSTRFSARSSPFSAQLTLRSHALDGQSQFNRKHMKNANCLQEFVHKGCSKCLPLARTHAWVRFIHWSLALSIMPVRNQTILQSIIPSVRQQCFYSALVDTLLHQVPYTM